MEFLKGSGGFQRPFEDEKGDGEVARRSLHIAKGLVPKPSRDLWYIGGVNDVPRNAWRKNWERILN